MSVLAARARGLGSRLASADALAAVERAPDRAALVSACTAIGLPGDGSPAAIEEVACARTAAELAILDRWSADDVLGPLFLDEDRRTVRAIVRGLAANVPPAQRIAGVVTTPTLRPRLVARVANATTFAGIGEALGDHVLAGAIVSDDPFEIELALARTLARTRARDAVAVYVRQVVDIENATSALLLADRHGDLAVETCFVAGGDRIDRATFLAACESLDAARDKLGHTFARTPLASAFYAPDPAAVEDAALAWQLATQATLRRHEPLGLAAAVYFVLRRRAELRRIRRAAWRLALGGAA